MGEEREEDGEGKERGEKEREKERREGRRPLLFTSWPMTSVSWH